MRFRGRDEVDTILLVVLLTAAKSREKIDDAVDVADHVEKPFRANEVVDCVQRVLGGPASN